LTLRVSLVRMPLLSAFSNSGRTMLARNALILRLAREETEAMSECVTDESLSCTGEDNGTAFRAIRDVLAKEVRSEPPTPAEFLAAVERVDGNQMAKAAVEMLLWDYHAKVGGLSLDAALGGSRGYADAGVAIGLGGEDDVLARVGAAVERGYRRVKVKIDGEGALRTLGAVRGAFPDAPLSADANACFKLPKDLELLKGIDRFDLEYLEQPLGFDAVADHSRLAKEIATPICLDESVTTLEGAREALESGAASVINVKPGRVGGLGVAMEVVRLARKKKSHAWVGGMLETGIGRAFNVALASQRLVDYPGDTSPNDRYFERDLVKNPFEMKEGRVRPNRGKGIGVELDEGLLVRHTVKTWELS
jgi:o-succinylbenzoate synthase